MKNLAIIGPGLLGGSIALAARARGAARIAMWSRRDDAAKEVERLGIADLVTTDLWEAVADATLVVLCVPVGAMRELAEQILPVIGADVVVTDVGSVKAVVCGKLGAIFRERGHFVGSHPMAGSEQTGIAAARGDLFEDAAAIVTPDADTDPGALAFVRDFWKSLGSRVLEVSPEEHDRIVALVSHLPHLLAAALVNTVAGENAAAFDFCGPGFRDTTRVAGGPPEMWAEILHLNSSAVRTAVEALIEKLLGIATLLDRDQTMSEFLTQAKAQRDRLRLPR